MMPKYKSYEGELPDKLYFKIGEVSEIAGLPTHVLRFWESEFNMINPKRTPTGQRQYRKQDLELILNIKYLLYDKKYTIQGAKRHLRYLSKAEQEKPLLEKIDDIRRELKQIRHLLD